MITDRLKNLLINNPWRLLTPLFLYPLLPVLISYSYFFIDNPALSSYSSWFFVGVILVSLLSLVPLYLISRTLIKSHTGRWYFLPAVVLTLFHIASSLSMSKIAAQVFFGQRLHPVDLPFLFDIWHLRILPPSTFLWTLFYPSYVYYPIFIFIYVLFFKTIIFWIIKRVTASSTCFSIKEKAEGELTPDYKKNNFKTILLFFNVFLFFYLILGNILGILILVWSPYLLSSSSSLFSEKGLFLMIVLFSAVSFFPTLKLTPKLLSLLAQEVTLLSWPKKALREVAFLGLLLNGAIVLISGFLVLGGIVAMFALSAKPLNIGLGQILISVLALFPLASNIILIDDNLRFLIAVLPLTYIVVRLGLRRFTEIGTSLKLSFLALIISLGISSFAITTMEFQPPSINIPQLLTNQVIKPNNQEEVERAAVIPTPTIIYPSPTITPTPTPAGNIFTSNEGGFSFSYPYEWTVTECPEYLKFPETALVIDFRTNERFCGTDQPTDVMIYFKTEADYNREVLSLSRDKYEFTIQDVLVGKRGIKAVRVDKKAIPPENYDSDLPYDFSYHTYIYISHRPKGQPDRDYVYLVISYKTEVDQEKMNKLLDSLEIF